MSDIDETQNWVTLRARHQVTCQDCETLITLLEQERDALRTERQKYRDALDAIRSSSAEWGIERLFKIANAALEGK